MGYLPGDCKPKQPEIPKGARAIIDAVMNGKAFQNPQAATNGSIGNNSGAAIGGLDETEPDQLALADKLRTINEGLAEFKTHTNKLSGKGAQSDFSQIFGIAGAYNDAKESLEKNKKDHFKDMFGGLVNGGKKMDQMDGLMENIAKAVPGSSKQSQLISEAMSLKNNLISIKNSDNANLDKAMSYVVKKGMGEGIASITKPGGAGNCFGTALFDKFIASPTMKQAIKVNQEAIPKKIEATLPNVSDIDMGQIGEGLGAGEAEAAASAERAASDEEVEQRINTLEEITLTLGSSTQQNKIDGGSYGVSS